MLRSGPARQRHTKDERRDLTFSAPVAVWRKGALTAVAVSPCDAADVCSPDWYLERARAASIQGGGGTTFDFDEYLRRLSASALKPKVIRTLAATAETASSRGTTSVDRVTIATVVGCDESTITQHWKLARRAGLMRSTRRWNTSSIHDFTVDGSTVIDYGSTDLAPHPWSANDGEWWQAANHSTRPTPWGDGPSPF